MGRGMSESLLKTHPLPRGGTDLMGRGMSESLLKTHPLPRGSTDLMGRGLSKSLLDPSATAKLSKSIPHRHSKLISSDREGIRSSIRQPSEKRLSKKLEPILELPDDVLKEDGGERMCWMGSSVCWLLKISSSAKRCDRLIETLRSLKAGFGRGIQHSH